jgi:hypothetical protein
LRVGFDDTQRDSVIKYESPRLLNERADADNIWQTAVQKILYNNAKILMGCREWES